MSTMSQEHSGPASATSSTLDMKLEIVVIPVSDVDRAKRFYGDLGWRLDADFAAPGGDFRVIQFTPPGSPASVIFGKNVTAAAPGSAQGLYLTESFYWDLNDRTRAFTKRVLDKMPRKQPPNMIQAGCYAGTLHYLKAVDKVGSPADGKAVVAAMKAMPTDDPLFGQGSIRPDGRKLHPMYLYQVKSPAESKGAWDYLKTIATIPADQAFRPLAEGNCPLVVSR